MDSTLEPDTIDQGPVHWIYRGASYNLYMYLLSEDPFYYIYIFITSSVDPDETPHYAAFHLGLHCS